MNPAVDAFLRSWPSDPWLVAALALCGALYLRGWLVLRRRDAKRWHGGRLAAFGGALGGTFLALASPIEPFSSLLLQMHMVQHLLLMMVVPPLVWLSDPLFPFLRGLPREVRTYWAAPLLRLRPLRRCFTWLVQPLVAWLLFAGVTWLWHLPPCYELSLRSGGWHVAEHACFLAAGLLFWYPVVQPYPSRARYSRWLLPPYLVLMGVQSTVLAAWLTFSGVVLYPHYASVPRLGGISALDDQAAAGAIMWVFGSIVLLVPLFAIGVKLFSPLHAMPRRRKPATAGRRPARSMLPILQTAAADCRASSRPAAFDLLRVPLVGPLLRQRYVRRLAQLAVLLAAAIVIYDGLRGPQVAAMNLAGVLPWIHWRGVLVLGLLVAGNFFCMACPFTLPRAAARRWLPARYLWPRWLNNKWLAVVLVVLFLWSYEALALWDRPWLTAWIAVGYFVAAFAVDGLFRGASFCKFVCPIGQFNFVQSLVSPLEVGVRQPEACTSCRTHECLRGNSSLPGCEMQLFQPRKSGNLDCTFCLDCVRACPHENVGVLAVAPGHSLWTDRFRLGVGRLGDRPDLAALVLVLVFGGLANAGGMVGPVVEWQDRLREMLGGVSLLTVTSLFYACALIIVPLVLVAAATWATRAWAGLSTNPLGIATRFSYVLVPVGFAVWLAHYSFHFLTSADTIVPAAQRFAADLGGPWLGEPMWQLACCRPVTDSLTHLQVLFLDGGLLLSLYTGFRIAEKQSTGLSQALRAFAPWAVLTVAVFLVAVWIVYQPMEMRGTLGMGG